VKAAERACNNDRLGAVALCVSLGRHALADRLMRPALVEVELVLPKQTLEMPVVEKQNVVEQLASGATDEALCHRVHVRPGRRS